MGQRVGQEVGTHISLRLLPRQVRADAESDGQRLSYLLNAGSNYFTFAEVTLSAEHWTRMYGVARLEQAQIDAVRQNGYADVYPLSSSFFFNCR